MVKKKFPIENIENYTELYSPFFKIFTVEDSYNFCKLIATKHYENFLIVFPFLSYTYRRYFYAVYSFARLCDDISDEQYYLINKGKRIEFLNKIEKNLKNLSYTKIINNPIFLALKDTIDRNELPTQPFLNLLEAFRRDINFTQPESFTDLEDYCKFSANPIGELVLYLFRDNNEKTIQYSNSVCTALQLVNFWQDLSIDIPRGRIYIPKELLSKYKLTNKDLLKIEKKEILDLVLDDLFDYTKKFFNNGWKLLFYLTNRFLKYQVQIYILGGLEIFRKELNLSSKLFHKRPRLNLINFLKIIFQTFI